MHAVLDLFGNKSSHEKVEQQVGLMLSVHVMVSVTLWHITCHK
jgi:hypothetical protein